MVTERCDNFRNNAICASSGRSTGEIPIDKNFILTDGLHPHGQQPLICISGNNVAISFLPGVHRHMDSTPNRILNVSCHEKATGWADNTTASEEPYHNGKRERSAAKVRGNNGAT